MDDLMIIELYFARDEQAIEETDTKYGKLCFHMANNFLSNDADAEECVNDTYLSAWNSMPTHRPTYLAPYLAKLTRWLSLNRLRDGNSLKRGGREIPAVLDELAETLDPGADVEKEIAVRELNAAIRNMLESLGKTERDIFLSRYWYAASISEIAWKSGFTESKVKSMLHRTRCRLLKQLKEDGLC